MARKKTTSSTSSKSVKKKTVSNVALKKAPKKSTTSKLTAKSVSSGKKTVKSTPSRSSKSVFKTPSVKKSTSGRKTAQKGADLKGSAKKSVSLSSASTKGKSTSGKAVARKKNSSSVTGAKNVKTSAKAATKKAGVSTRRAGTVKVAAATSSKKVTIKTKATKNLSGKTATTRKAETKKSALSSVSKNKPSAVSRANKASGKLPSKTADKEIGKSKAELKKSGTRKVENTNQLDSSDILAGKKSQSVVNTASSLKKEDSSTSKRNMSKNTPTAAENSSSTGIVISNPVNGNGAAPLNTQIAISTEEAEVPVKRKRGRPRKSESANGASAKLKETKGVRRFGMNYGRPGVAAGRYSWSAETGSSLVESPNEEEKVSLLDEVEVTSNETEVEFNQGDKVVYPAHGLGIVEAVQVRTVGGSHQKFYMISIVETGMKIMVPVGQSKTVGLRRVVDPTTVDQVYDILRDKDIVIDNQTWNRRYREYSQKIKTGSVLEIASVIRDLTVLKIEKELSFNERRMLDTAQGLLVKELSIAKASSEDSIKEELELICQP
jgi:CarD family transcriptional regulator